MKIAVMSDGGWGTALSLLLVDNGHETTLWGPFPDYIKSMREQRENTEFLPGVPLPSELHLSQSIPESIADAELLVLAAPSRFMRSLLEQLAEAGANADKRPLPVLNVAKGLEQDTDLRMSELVETILGDVEFATLSGPSHAEEVARKMPTAVTVASRSPALADQVQQTFMNDRFRVYTQDDVIGVELGGALKNVFAIAAGVSDGLGFGDNARAALMTRGIVEMGRLGEALGGRADTFSGLSGVGDLIVTCTSQHSRNHFVGEQLGKGHSLEEVQASMGRQVAEGVRTARAAFSLARKHHTPTPIIDEIHAVLYDGKNPRRAVTDLMTRNPKAESTVTDLN
ncbi:MAG: NAD(P)H-dependent glycerol-3-phosphate dehydrogenase [Verrucomicrobiota bacterium]